MIFKFSKIYGIILITFFINSCGLLKESNNIVDYKTKNFDYSSSPEKPNYESLSNWLVHPEKNQDKYSFLSKNNNLLKADVFLLYQLCFLIKKMNLGILVWMMIIFLKF